MCFSIEGINTLHVCHHLNVTREKDIGNVRLRWVIEHDIWITYSNTILECEHPIQNQLGRIHVNIVRKKNFARLWSSPFTRLSLTASPSSQRKYIPMQ